MGQKQTRTCPHRKEEKHLYGISFERHHSGFWSIDRNSKHQCAKPTRACEFALRTCVCLERLTARGTDLNRSVPWQGLCPQHANQILSTGKQVAQQMGPKLCQDNRFQGRKAANGRYCESLSQRVFHQLRPLKRKIIGPKAVIVLCLIFMVGFGGLFQHSLLSAPL